MILSQGVRRVFKEETMNKEVKDVIREIRDSTGLSRKAFSEKTGIPLRTMEDWEAGRRKPPEYVTKFMAYWVRMNMVKKN